jgi:hypothetical protein
MDNQRHAAAMSDVDVDRELAQALAVDPSPGFTARVRARIPSEPAPRFVFAPWRVAAIATAAGAVALAVVIVNRANQSELAVAIAPLVARTTVGASTLPYATSGSSRSYVGSGFSRAAAAGPPKGGRPVQILLDQVLLDPRETAALRALLAGVRDNRVDLTPLLQPGTPTAMDLPPVDDLVIAPIAIELLAPDTGAQGERQ